MPLVGYAKETEQQQTGQGQEQHYDETVLQSHIAEEGHAEDSRLLSPGLEATKPAKDWKMSCIYWNPVTIHEEHREVDSKHLTKLEH
ncbi:MAG: hypothetical protein HQL78_04935 [Magnetococcales bacterium]|nr:hypothetical protein [Magnetococcales bacterium]